MRSAHPALHKFRPDRQTSLIGLVKGLYDGVDKRDGLPDQVDFEHYLQGKPVDPAFAYDFVQYFTVQSNLVQGFGSRVGAVSLEFASLWEQYLSHTSQAARKSPHHDEALVRRLVDLCWLHTVRMMRAQKLMSSDTPA